MYGDAALPPADQATTGDLMVRAVSACAAGTEDAASELALSGDSHGLAEAERSCHSQGHFECVMSDLMSSRAKPLKPLTCSKKGRGGEPGMKVLVEEVRAVKGEAQITLWSKKLANRAGWFSSNTAYATLSKLREDGNYVLVARTPTAPKGANPPGSKSP